MDLVTFTEEILNRKLHLLCIVIIFTLTLSVTTPDEEKKITAIFIFTLLCGPSKGFMKVLKAFIKPFEAPQKSVKIKI